MPQSTPARLSAPAYSGLSRELQIGKAAEHLVCYDLIMQGHNAMLADQGIPFDIVVIGDGGRLCRVQVKATSKTITTAKNPNPHYRFGLRRGVRGSRVMSAAHVDVLAFVALDIRAIAYIPIDDLVSARHGGVVQAVDFYSGQVEARVYSTGTIRNSLVKQIADYATFCGFRGSIAAEMAAAPKAKRPVPHPGTLSNVKITPQQVGEIRERRATGEPLALLAAAYGISIQSVCDIAKGRTWRHV